LNIRRELIERGGTSKLGVDLCRVTTKGLLAQFGRPFSFETRRSVPKKVSGVYPLTATTTMR
jgi:hypothetical protein